MSVLSSIQSRVRRLFAPNITETDPEKAYDLWAEGYDDQPDNLILALDEEMFSGLLAEVSITGKVLIDVGCGTGRHWKKLLDARPAALSGYDVSAEMLRILQNKFPQQQVFQSKDHHLNTATGSCDLVISTLALAHMPDGEQALEEWFRVLKPGGQIILTDYHPGALAQGGNRTFRHNDQLFAVKNYIYPVARVQQVARQLGAEILRFSERRIDESVKPFYEKQNALGVYEKFRGVPILYGIHLKKTDAVT